ncbi:MAG: hypothetical protein ACM3PY_17820 [Omnitrophica WOR_2 bacterium]
MINNGVPSGNTTEAAHAFYNYLWGNYLASIPAPRTTILWSGPIYVALFVIVLTLFFYLYSRYANRVHRNKGEMYGIMSFAGSILERIGPLSVFEYFIWIVLILWVLYYIVTQIISGYIYVLPVH